MPTDAPTEIEFYWRPGCGFCMSLDRQINKHGLEVTKHNIWADPEAAAHVRSVANGNETVPTVTVGKRSLVNPSIDQVVGLVGSQAPHLLPEGYEPPEPSRVGKVISRLLGG